jgi:L-ascorbate metabolism protein UlaG (beta-lactamase superfamily)
MLKLISIAISILACNVFLAYAQTSFERDTIQTSAGNLAITFIGHGTLMMNFDGKIIHIDPYGKLADYENLPEADLVFLTHHHRDHLDLEALNHIRTDSTIVVLTKKCAESVDGGIIMENGDAQTISGITVEAIPAYNLVHKRDNGKFYHPKGEGNGYVMTFGDKRIYIAGDTENTPEMKALEDIDVAFLPMNLPYTMTPEMVADAAKSFQPDILYPYHYGDTDPSKLMELLEDVEGVDVRVRDMR